MYAYELTSGDEPVDVTVDGDNVTVALGSLSITFTTHRDADTGDDMSDAINALAAITPAFAAAVDRHKFVQSTQQAMIVLLAEKTDATPHDALSVLRFHDDDQCLASDGGEADAKRFRAEARGYLHEKLFEHGWTRVLGNRLGLAPESRQHAVNLDDGAHVKSEPFAVGRHEVDWEWVDATDMTVDPANDGDWWITTGGMLELPYDPWIAELELIHRQRLA